MTARRFDLLVTSILLAFGTWYGLEMLSYPDAAGLVPAITAAIMVAALVVQLALSLRKPRTTGDGSGATAVAPAPVSVVHRAEAAVGLDDLSAVRHAVEEKELEQDSYDNLIALRGLRRRRFLAISLFTGAFYVGYLLVGFVVTTGLLMAAILGAARERPHVVVIGGLAGTAAAYALVVALLGIPAMSGYLVP